jgi:hypothetical protein
MTISMNSISIVYKIGCSMMIAEDQNFRALARCAAALLLA